MKNRFLRYLARAVVLAPMAMLPQAHAADAASTSPDLLAAYATISQSRFVDLTHTFSPSIPVWHGFGGSTVSRAADPQTSRVYTIEEDGFRSQVFAQVGQYGTHVDPPAHFYEKGATLDEIGVDQMILPLQVIDVTPQLTKEPNHALSVADIEHWETQHGKIPKGSFVALRTDMSKDWEKAPERFKRFPFPGWSLPAVQFLIEHRGVVAIGHESLDTDATETMESEVWLLTQGHWQIEVMSNLDQLPATGSLIVATWPKPKSGLGFPARVFAIVPKT